VLENATGSYVICFHAKRLSAWQKKKAMYFEVRFKQLLSTYKVLDLRMSVASTVLSAKMSESIRILSRKLGV
jgi:hypothetical protein